MLGFREAASLPAVKWREKNLGGLNKRKHERSSCHDWKMCSFKTDDCGSKKQNTLACFIEPMLCLAVEKLPESPGWQCENENGSPRDRNDNLARTD